MTAFNKIMAGLEEAHCMTFAAQAHGAQKYGVHPYMYHLSQVADIVYRYHPSNRDFHQAAFLHDVLEDTDVTYVELAEKFGVQVATIVWACTGEGENRKARQECIRLRLIDYPNACPVKCADRIANVSTSIAEGRSDKFKMYLEEHDAMSAIFVGNVTDQMLKELDALMERGKKVFNV